MSVIERAYFSGGCFWCTEAIYNRLKGVLGVKPGFSGGNLKNPSYKEVCTGRTGHAETVEVIYDSSQIDFQLLLEVFFKTHDPTTINRQGNDIGTHYRSIVFYSNSKERELVTNYIDFLNNKIYDLQYENLVNDTRKEVEKLLKFCSLEWDDKCLDHQKNKRVIKTISYNQARKPIYNTSVKSFKGYEDYLNALKDLN